MADLNTRSAIGTIRRGYTATGTAIPAALEKAIATHDRITEAASKLGGRDYLEAVYASLEAGNDPAADPNVTAAYMATHLGSGTAASVSAKAADELALAVRANANDIHDAFRPAFEKAAKTLTESYKKLDGRDLDNTHAILALGGSSASTWTAARAAADTIAAVENAIAALDALNAGDPRRHAYRIADHSHPDTHADVDPRAGAWSLLGDGWTLSYATRAEFKARLARANDTRAQRAADHDQKRRRLLSIG